jgi:hypothetical protein
VYAQAKTESIMDWNHRWLLRGLVLYLALIFLIVSCSAHDTDPEITAWMATLRQPDMPSASCCGEADAYFADETIVIGNRVYAVITDNRPDAPLHRPHIAPGTRIEIPPNKYGARPTGNPTEHAILFVRESYDHSFMVYCFVQSSGS